jgi:Ca2+-transporting ATPase
MAADETAAQLGTEGTRGLSVDAAAERLRASGPNTLADGRRCSLLAMFFGQLADFMILVLLAAALISGFIGEPMDTLAVLVILILNAVIGAVQEFRAERAVAALRRMAVPQATVLRDGRQQTIDGAAGAR